MAISICNGAIVRDLLAHAECEPYRYRVVLIVSPFIDDEGGAVMVELANRCGGPTFDLRIVTRPENKCILGLFNRPTRGLSVKYVHNLHAKVYALLGNSTHHHEAVVTSANLTAAGLHSNVELGTRIIGTSIEHHRLVSDLFAWERTLRG